MDGEPREFPQNSREFGEEGGPREMHGAAHRALMTAASIIWSFWANGQITGERRDYCYYMRPRTQSKPDYTLVSQSLSGLLLPVRLSESRCWEGARSLFKRFYAHHPIIRLLSLQLFPLAREIWISRKWISIFRSETFFFFYRRIWVLRVWNFSESKRKTCRETRGGSLGRRFQILSDRRRFLQRGILISRNCNCSVDSGTRVSSSRFLCLLITPGETKEWWTG